MYIHISSEKGWSQRKVGSFKGLSGPATASCLVYGS